MQTYTASINLKVKKEEEEKELTASSRGQSKKLAAKGCALQLLAQLYKLTLVEANLTSTSPLNKKKNPNGRMKVILKQMLDTHTSSIGNYCLYLNITSI